MTNLVILVGRIARDPETRTKGLTGRTVLFTFPGEAAAKAWFDDPDYQALSEHRRNGTTLSFITLVHGQPRQD